MGKPKTSGELINRIQLLRQRGHSLQEICSATSLGYGTVYRYIKNVEILPEYRIFWIDKRGGSKRRMIKAQIRSQQEAVSIVDTLNPRDVFLLLASLYWGEGSKNDLNFVNSDPKMIQFFVYAVIHVLKISPSRLKVSLRLFEDLDIATCIAFWSGITCVPPDQITQIEFKPGKKNGKLAYGMCRVRILKGSQELKLLVAIKEAIIQQIICPRSSMDRTAAS